MYANRDSLTKHDLAFLITNSIGENEFGIATVGGVCSVDLKDLEDLGAVVVYDRGLFKSMGIAAHEIGHAYVQCNIRVLSCHSIICVHSQIGR